MITARNNAMVSAPLIFFFPQKHPMLGKLVILYYFSLETEVPDDEYYDEDDHNEVVQYLLDVVDEEAQNLLNRNNTTSEAQSLLHLKKAASEDHPPGKETLKKHIVNSKILLETRCPVSNWFGKRESWHWIHVWAESFPRTTQANGCWFQWTSDAV